MAVKVGTYYAGHSGHGPPCLTFKILQKFKFEPGTLREIFTYDRNGRSIMQVFIAKTHNPCQKVYNK